MRSTRRRQVRAALLLAVASLGVASALHSPDAEAGGNGRTGKFVPAQGALFGLWSRRGEMTKANVQANIANRETQLGRKLDIDHHFYKWDSALPSWKESWDIANGRTPLIAWSTVNTLEVNAGQWDTHIRNNARGLKALNHPVFLRWFWEPEWTQRTALTNGTVEYQKAWRRIYNLFQQEGATNVAFVYCATAWGFVTGTAQSYYPGDAYVDWVCSDGYNWAPGKPKAKWDSWETIFRPTHDFAVAHNKPMMAGEIGVQEGTAGQKAAWFSEAQSQIKTGFPNLAAFVYYDEDRSMYSGEYNWQIDTSTSSLNAWIGIGRDPYFNTSAGPLPSTTTAAPTTIAPTTAPPTTSAPTTTAPPPPPPTAVFADNFDSGSLSTWTRTNRATLSAANAQSGAAGVVVTTSSGGAFVAKTLSSSRGGLTVDVWLKVIQRPNVGTSLIHLRDSGGAGLISVNLRPNGEVIIRDPANGKMTYSGTIVPTGAWQRVTLLFNSTTGNGTVALNGVPVPGLTVSGAAWVGGNIASFELGDMGGQKEAKTFSFAFDSLTVL